MKLLHIGNTDAYHSQPIAIYSHMGKLVLKLDSGETSINPDDIESVAVARKKRSRRPVARDASVVPAMPVVGLLVGGARAAAASMAACLSGGNRMPMNVAIRLTNGCAMIIELSGREYRKLAKRAYKAPFSAATRMNG